MDIVTYALCNGKINKIIKDAPEALDSLKEIADWIEKNNKQVDWNQLDSLAVDYIKNKPEIMDDEDLINFLINNNSMPAIKDKNGNILSAKGNIIIW